MLFLTSSRLIMSLLLLCLLGCQPAPTPPPPNVVFILVDDLGWKDLGCYGSSFYETPNLDAFAQESMRFTDAYSSCPVCSPSRASIMTGKAPTRLNITDWIPGQNPKGTPLIGPVDREELPLEEITLGEVFQQQGYATFFAGKWHLGGEGFYPEDQGFEQNFGGHEKGSPPGGYYSPYKNPRLSDGPEGEYLTDRLTTESIRFMETQSQTEQPFFLFLSYYTVHTPIQASKRHLPYFEEKTARLFPDHQAQQVAEHTGMTRTDQVHPAYASMVYAMDENVGRLLNKIKDLGLSDNTIIVFTSDNGGLSTLRKERIAPTSVRPLRGGKGWCYEGGIRVPLIIKAPGITRAGTESHAPVIGTDLFSSLLDLSGIPSTNALSPDGMSVKSLLEGEPNLDREAIFWHYPHYHGSMWTPGAAVRMGDWKLIEWYETDVIELYNLKEDLEEKNDLSAQYPDKVKELKDRLAQWQSETGALFPATRP